MGSPIDLANHHNGGAIDPDGKTLTVLSKDATAGSAFSYGLCGYELNTGWSPYCGSFPED